MGDEDRRTLWCGNLPDKATEELLYELFLQAGPLERVKIPKDKDGRQRNFSFVTFLHEVSVGYAIELFRGTELFQRTLSLQMRGGPRFQSRDFPRELPPVQQDVHQQFEEMTNHLAFDNPLNNQYGGKNATDDRIPQLSMVSLQGNWSTRHHPYQRDDYSENNHRNHNVKGWDDGHHHNSRSRPKNLKRHFKDDHRGGNYGRNHGWAKGPRGGNR